MRQQMCRFTNCHGIVEMRAIGDRRFEGSCESCGEHHECEVAPASGPWTSDGSNGFVERAGKGRSADDSRAAMVRLVVAQQWAAFIAVMGCEMHERIDGTPIGPDDVGAADWNGGVTEAERALAALPSAVDVVADLLGAP